MKKLKKDGVDSSHKSALRHYYRGTRKHSMGKKLLGYHTPQTLLDTMVYNNGLYFALRSGMEHRQLQFSPPQITVVEPLDDVPYLLYNEDVSKNHCGGLRA